MIGLTLYLAVYLPFVRDGAVDTNLRDVFDELIFEAEKLGMQCLIDFDLIHERSSITRSFSEQFSSGLLLTSFSTAGC